MSFIVRYIKTNTGLAAPPVTNSPTQHVSEDHFVSAWNEFHITAKDPAELVLCNAAERKAHFGTKLTQLWEYLSNNYIILSYKSEPTPKMKLSKEVVRRQILDWYKGNDLTHTQKLAFKYGLQHLVDSSGIEEYKIKSKDGKGISYKLVLLTKLAADIVRDL